MKNTLAIARDTNFQTKLDVYFFLHVNAIFIFRFPIERSRSDRVRTNVPLLCVLFLRISPIWRFSNACAPHSIPRTQYIFRTDRGKKLEPRTDTMLWKTLTDVSISKYLLTRASLSHFLGNFFAFVSARTAARYLHNSGDDVITFPPEYPFFRRRNRFFRYIRVHTRKYNARRHGRFIKQVPTYYFYRSLRLCIRVTRFVQ